MATARCLRRGAGVVLLAILLAGCGGGSSSHQRADDQLDALEATIATQYETAATPYNDYLAKATHRYILLVRRYAHDLGPKAARERLMSESDEASSFCPPCAGALRDEARRH